MPIAIFNLADSAWGEFPSAAAFIELLSLVWGILALAILARRFLPWKELTKRVKATVLVAVGIVCIFWGWGIWHNELTIFDQIAIGPNVLTLSYPFNINRPISIPFAEILDVKIGRAPNWNDDSNIQTFEIDLHNGNSIISTRRISTEELESIESTLKGVPFARCQAILIESTTTQLFETNNNVWIEYFDQSMCSASVHEKLPPLRS